MKILIPVLHYAPVIGGLETWTQNIAERLSDKAEVFVITGKVKGQLREEIRKGIKISRTSLYSLKNLSHSSWLYIFTALPFIFFKSLRLIKREEINILHCQGFLSSLLGCLLSRLTKIPFIVTVQRMENKTGFKKMVYRRAACCIAASAAIKRYLQEIGCRDIKVIPNGIDLPRFKGLDREKNRQDLGIKDEFVIMTVARLERVKGIGHLIRAIKDVQYLVLNIGNFQLLIIGDGSERKSLENLVRGLNLRDRVKFLGQVANEEIPEYLAAADCFCLPSLKEGFGISILEAQAAGLPVIATNVGGIPDIIENGKTGILVEPKKPEQISRALIKIGSEEKFAKDLVSNARTNLINYNWQNIAQKVYDAYSQIVLR